MDWMDLVEEVMRCVEEGVCTLGEITELGIECIFGGVESACKIVEEIIEKLN
jgi:hypothetical protein